MEKILIILILRFSTKNWFIKFLMKVYGSYAGVFFLDKFFIFVLFITENKGTLPDRSWTLQNLGCLLRDQAMHRSGAVAQEVCILQVELLLFLNIFDLMN